MTIAYKAFVCVYYVLNVCMYVSALCVKASSFILSYRDIFRITLVACEIKFIYISIERKVGPIT